MIPLFFILITALVLVSLLQKAVPSFSVKSGLKIKEGKGSERKSDINLYVMLQASSNAFLIFPLNST